MADNFTEQLDDNLENYNGLNTLGETIEEETNRFEKIVLNRVGTFINTKRTEKKLTIRELKKRSHVSLAVITDLEKGNSMPRVETLIRLAIALEIDFNDVFNAMILPKSCKTFNIKDNKHSKNSKSKQQAELATSIAGFGYNKDQVAEILEFIEFIDFKHSNNNKRNKSSLTNK